ncbi:hypothetical protein XENOCAPTIV_026986 [Xenoophorus captivus]|uniref:Uncharacterized protein n=1 Tax=Xenoophorus captivus TaxID=1517983 RepID=A0ABV0S193_9TELE
MLQPSVYSTLTAILLFTGLTHTDQAKPYNSANNKTKSCHGQQKLRPPPEHPLPHTYKKPVHQYGSHLYLSDSHAHLNTPTTQVSKPCAPATSIITYFNHMALTLVLFLHKHHISKGIVLLWACILFLL